MRAIRLHPATLAATCLLVLAGCGGVDFVHPLSDEKTSEVDARLIGFWEVLPASIGEEEPGEGELWPHIAVGRSSAAPTYMEAVSMELEDEFVKVERYELRATRIGDHRYLCLLSPGEEDATYLVLRYAVAEDDRLNIRILDEEVLAKAVEAGDLEGKVTGRDDDGLEPLSVRVTTSTAGVRAWLEEHADTCVKAEGLAMRRLVEKASEDEAVAKPSEGPDEEDDAEDDE